LAEAGCTRQFLAAMLAGLRTQCAASEVSFNRAGSLPAVFPVSDFAAAAVGAAGAAVADLMTTAFGAPAPVQVDRILASHWCGFSIRPVGWALPSPWDPIAGDYAAADGWIRLHTNAPHHRAAALAVLGVPADKQAVAAAVQGWSASELESAIIDNRGCAAVMRSLEQWQRHPQGAAVSAEPLLHAQATPDVGAALHLTNPTRPLEGIRVLDLTRVLAGPVATRFLAGFGAQVLRIDPPNWDEPAVVPDVTLGKRCARLDLRRPTGRNTLLALLDHTDVLVHGYRPDALAQLGLDAPLRRARRPGLVDVSLDAYGWSGPWRLRRGFDSLVQMSAGIAEAGMRIQGRDRPTPLPVQGLDHVAGYLLAAMAVHGLSQRLQNRQGFEGRTSLARVAALLTSVPAAAVPDTLTPADEGDFSSGIEASDFGPARRLRSPLTVADLPLRWDRPAARLGSSGATWE
jgi:hypothetical protein